MIKAKFSLIIREGGEYVYLMDGNPGPWRNLRKKKKKHLQPISYRNRNHHEAKLMADETVVNESGQTGDSVSEKYESKKQEDVR